MATVIAVINLKGGVGKTTTSVAFAEFLAGIFGKKVLLVDLDPQTNATVMLIGEKKWLALNERQRTLARLFQDAMEEPSDRQFDLEGTLQRNVSNVNAVSGLDLLPSSLDLIDLQDQLGSMSSGRFHSDVPTDILRRATRPIIDEYDYVVIDCPPNLGIITLNGLRISNGYIIPVIPDILSTYGIPQIVSRVEAFADAIGEPIDPLGIIVSHYREQSTVHRNTLGRLTKGDVPVFETIIPLNAQISAAAEFKPISTLRQKYGYQGQCSLYSELTKEIMEAAEHEPVR
jgi:chromosome partitioning protein